jgi:hypothetical protein
MMVFWIFLLGAGVLACALGLNLLASALGLMSWYDFLKNPGAASALSYLWLFVLYPFGLGAAAYGVGKALGF